MILDLEPGMMLSFVCEHVFFYVLPYLHSDCNVLTTVIVPVQYVVHLFADVHPWGPT